MENEVQPNVSPVQPLPPTLSPISTQSSISWSKVLLFTVLGLIVVAGSFFAGIQIGKNQTPNQQPITIQPTTSPTETVVNSKDQVEYVLFNENYQTGTPKFLIGDKITLGDQCSTRIKGTIKSINNVSFAIEETDKESGDNFNPTFHPLEKSVPLVIKTSTYIANEGKRSCTDIDAKGTTIFISKSIDKNGKNYLNILQSLDAISTMPRQ